MKGKREKTHNYLPTYLCILSPTLPGSFSSSLLEISSSHGLPSRNKRRESTWLSRAKSEQSFSISLEYNKRSYTLHVPFPSQARTSIFHSDGMLLGRHPSFTPPVARAVVYAPYLSLSRSRNRVCWPRPTCNIWPLARSAEESFKSAGFDKRISTVARADADNALGGTRFVTL